MSLGKLRLYRSGIFSVFKCNQLCEYREKAWTICSQLSIVGWKTQRIRLSSKVQIGIYFQTTAQVKFPNLSYFPESTEREKHLWIVILKLSLLSLVSHIKLLTNYFASCWFIDVIKSIKMRTNYKVFQWGYWFSLSIVIQFERTFIFSFQVIHCLSTNFVFYLSLRCKRK